MSTDTLRDAHNQLRRDVRKVRDAYRRSPESAFASTMAQAMEDFRTARKGGVSFEDGCRGIEGVLRSCWPRPTSKFAAACELCDDTGWRERYCSDAMRCGRRRCAENPSLEHRYVEPCGCERGDRHRKQVRDTDHAIAAAGKTKKAKGFSRL